MRFRYIAFDAQGRRLAGELAAASEADVLRALRGQGVTVSEVARVPGIAKVQRTRLHQSSVLRQLGLMLRAGVAIADALSVMQEADFDPSLAQVERLVRAGMPLSAALREARFPVPRYVPALISASEARGTLGEGLVEASELLARMRELRSELVTQLIYPAILIFSGVVAVLLLFAFVVPKFAGLLQSARAELPWVSVVVLQAGRLFSDHWVALTLSVITSCALLAIILASPQRRVQTLNAMCHVPGVASFVARFEIARWLRVIANLTGGHLRLLHSLEVAHEVLLVDPTRSALDRVVRKVRSGEMLSSALAETGLLSRQQTMIIRSGERSGALASALAQLAQDEEVGLRTKLRRLIVVLEPVCILAIGACIGLLMAGIMLAVTSLSNVVL